MAVYLIRAGAFGDVKIGHAKDPLVRLRQLQTSSSSKLRIVRVLDGGREQEAALHERFSDRRAAGEWFRFTDEMLQDLGLPDLPIPVPKRHRMHSSETARGRFLQLVEDMIEAAGGSEVVARALGVPPWRIGPILHESYLSALVVLARQAGANLSFYVVRDALNAKNAEADAEDDKDLDDRILKENARFERDWIKRHPGLDPWWPSYVGAGVVNEGDEVVA